MRRSVRLMHERLSRLDEASTDVPVVLGGFEKSASLGTARDKFSFGTFYDNGK